MAPEIKTQVLPLVSVGSIIDTRYPEKTSTMDVVFHTEKLQVFRACNFRNLRNAAYFLDVLFVAQHIEREELVVSMMQVVGSRDKLQQAQGLERQAKVALIRAIKAQWGIDLMKK